MQYICTHVKRMITCIRQQCFDKKHDCATMMTEGGIKDNDDGDGIRTYFFIPCNVLSRLRAITLAQLDCGVSVGASVHAHVYVHVDVHV